MKDLLIPRFKVIANFPSSTFELGDILIPIMEGSDYYSIPEYKRGEFNVLNPDKYSYLFRKLEWWENRAEKEMPKYLKRHKTFFKIDNWKFNWRDVRIAFVKDKNITLVMNRRNYLPATEQEYNAHILKEELVEGVL